MIVLDTNVLSEPMKPLVSELFVRWMKSQTRSSLYTTTVSQGELLLGMELLATGKKQTWLRTAIEATLRDFEHRILPFDDAAARSYSKLRATRQALGRPISTEDAMIAGIVRSKGATLATRNIQDFSDCGIPLVNPWES
jgi:toxin FitB